MGKTLKRYHYLPMIDDANINDQGIDAAGVSTVFEATIILTPPDVNASASARYLTALYAVGEGANAGAATTAAEAKAIELLGLNGVPFNTDFATTAADAVTAGWTVDSTSVPVPESGNLYGSSKDVGAMLSKMPRISETGGRVNRVGFTRILIEGTFEKYGIFDEWSKESEDFDTDADMQMHIHREMINGAHELVEDLLQIDLLNSAGVIRYGGDAVSVATITGNNGSTPSSPSYADFVDMNTILDENRSPKHTRLISGTRMIDTKVINSARYLMIGPELISSVKRMTDYFGNQAFISVEHYARAGEIAIGEIGAVDQFRIIVVPEMAHWEGAGAAVTTNDGYRETGGNYNVYPMLTVGSEAFTTIGFQTDGKGVKFKIKSVSPESDIAYSAQNPYGELGFMSIKWYYGFMLLRPERIGLFKVVARL